MEINNIEELGNIIKTIRKEQGLTQRDLSFAAGVSVRLIVELEKGKRGVNTDTVIKICSMLGLKISINGN